MRAIRKPALLILLAACTWISPAQAQAAPASATISLEAYISSLNKLIEALARGGAAELAEVRASLPQMWRVQHRGQTVDVSLVWLGQLLNTMQTRPKEPEVLIRSGRRRLELMRDEAQRWLDSAPGGAAAARDKLDAILARAEFGKVRGPTWMDRIRAWIASQIGRFFDWLARRIGGFSITGGVILWSVIALLLILVTLWAYRFMQRRWREPGLNLKNVAPEKLSWRRWAQRALAAAAAGDYRAAVHHAYWAFIYRMEDNGAWQMDRARTHREYLRLLPAQHEQRSNLASMTRRFESVWYGRQTATADDFREAAASLERLGCLLGSIPATGKS